MCQAEAILGLSKELYLGNFMGQRHIPKYGTLNLYSMLGFGHKCTDRSKPNFEIKMMSPYHSVQMSTQC